MVLSMEIMRKMKTGEALNEVECKECFVFITEFIRERLSQPQFDQYIGLMKLFKSRGIQGEELLESLLNLFKEDELVTLMFETLMETEIRVLKNIDDVGEPKKSRKRRRGEATDDDETEDEEERYCRCRRCRIGREEAKMIVHNKKYGLEPTEVMLGPFRSIINPNLL